MEEQKQAKTGVTWVRLHLVPQSDNHSMPECVTGILTQETQSAYVLMKVLESVETDEGWETAQSSNMHFINRTYVWNCEILAVPPQLGDIGRPYNPYDTGGGLG